MLKPHRLHYIKSICFIVLIFSLNIANACTTFCLNKNGRIVFGRNYDWVTGVGMMHTNMRSLQKFSLSIEDGNDLRWVSLYGSVTFNQFGKEFPNGGMNEKGLVVELMWLNNSEYPPIDQRPSLSVLQWIQYQLDMAATVEEVIASDQRVRIFSTGTPQHYLVADRNGAVATIELLNGKMLVHRDENLPYPVLTNSTYSHSVASVKKKTIKRDNSLQRFTKACEMINHFKVTDEVTPIVDYAFKILDNVAMGDYTKWSIVYDIGKQVIYFKTSSKQEMKFVHMNALSFSCAKESSSYNLGEHMKGNILKSFKPFSMEENSRIISQAFKESSEQVNIPYALQVRMAKLPEKIKCK